MCHINMAILSYSPDFDGTVMGSVLQLWWTALDTGDILMG